MKIVVVPRAMVQHFMPDSPFMWITITDPGKDFVEIPEHFKPSLIARMALRFWDSEFTDQMPGGFWGPNNPPPALPLNETDLFSPELAAEIIRFIEGQLPYGDFDLLVNCEGGQSRSPAVGAALANIRGMKDVERDLFRRRYPNARVYQMILDAAQAPISGGIG